jgi:hypothetical protein
MHWHVPQVPAALHACVPAPLAHEQPCVAPAEHCVIVLALEEPRSADSDEHAAHVTAVAAMRKLMRMISFP